MNLPDGGKQSFMFYWSINFRLSRFFFKAWDFCKLCLEPWEIWREGSRGKENHFYSLPFGQAEATTSCKNVETLPRKNDLSCFKLPLVTGLWDIILTSLLPPIQSCSSKSWAWSCIASNFDKGWRGDHKHKIMDRPFIPKYGRVSQALLQLVVAFTGPDVISTSPKSFSSCKIDFTILPLFEFLKEHHLPVGQVKNIFH